MARVFKLAWESIDRVESVVWVACGRRLSPSKSVRSTWSSACVCMHSILELHSRLLLNSTVACRGVLTVSWDVMHGGAGVSRVHGS
jgi:hypothetical protein